MTTEFFLFCFAKSGNAYNFARRLQDISALDGWVHPYELMPGHPLK